MSSTSTPRVSVILTSFNHQKYIGEAITSILNQTYSDFELFIWDDASSDDSWSVINSYADPRIKAFRNEVRQRGVYGINRAISEFASGEYIAIHHSDDIWEPFKLQKQVAILDSRSDLGAVFANAQVITENGSPLTDSAHFYFNMFDQPNRSRHEWLRFFFDRGNALCHPSILIRKSCYEKCGLYRYGLAQSGDFNMWIRLCQAFEIHVIPEELVRFRVRDAEANSSGNRREPRVRGVYEYYKALDLYKRIDCTRDLFMIFPELAGYDRENETDIRFILAMAALCQPTSGTKQLFALDLLYQAISEPTRSSKLKRLYNFDYASFISLTAEYDVFSREEVAALASTISAIDNSWSWRLTKPLRSLDRLISEYVRTKHK